MRWASVNQSLSIVAGNQTCYSRDSCLPTLSRPSGMRTDQATIYRAPPHFSSGGAHETVSAILADSERPVKEKNGDVSIFLWRGLQRLRQRPRTTTRTRTITNQRQRPRSRAPIAVAVDLLLAVTARVRERPGTPPRPSASSRAGRRRRRRTARRTHRRARMAAARPDP
jgi:hypothetical protein